MDSSTPPTESTMYGHESVYEDSSWEAIHFENEDLAISKSIVARGQFGASYMLGRIRSIKYLSPHIDRRTMMKTCNKEDQEKCYSGLQAELNILYDICHTNVIQLVGYCSEVKDLVPHLILVYEYCSNGNLIKVLQKGRPYYDGGTYNPKKAINNEILSPGIFLNFCGWHLLRWATEIARGMEYLAFKGVVHGDLAARNILLTCDWTAKICNFGIGQRHIHHENTFAKELRKHVLPLAWMAPETIESLIYSEYSDVWSYGITLWEIYTLGDIPYNEEKRPVDPEFWVALLDDLRPTQPIYANDEMWNLMTSCWSFQSHDRPTFSKLKNFLERTVAVTKEKWGSTLSGHDCSGKKSLKGDVTEKAKTVSFAPQAIGGGGGALHKCFYAAEEVLFRQTHSSRTRLN